MNPRSRHTLIAVTAAALVAAAAPAADAAVTINAAGGTTAANGLRIVINPNTTFQIYREGAQQLYKAEGIGIAVGTTVTTGGAISLHAGATYQRSPGTLESADATNLYTETVTANLVQPLMRGRGEQLRLAAERGANAVIGFRYDATELMPGLTEVLAYGTAVIVEPEGNAGG